MLPTLGADLFDSCVTDPPYDLTANKKGGSGVASVNLSNPYGRARIGTGNGPGGFMGMKWDGTGIGFNVDLWRQVYRVLKPGAYLLAFGGSRTYHRLACAIEDAGFEIRDQIQWIYGSGFPKSLDVSKAIDREAGARREVVGKRPEHVLSNGWREREGRSDRLPESSLNITAPATAEARQWNGFGTALKPAHEPIVMARKPLEKGLTVAQNVLKWGTGGINIDGCRVDTQENLNGGGYTPRANGNAWAETKGMNAAGRCANEPFQQPTGRFPANVIHDGSDEVLAGFPETTSGGGDKRGGCQFFMNGDTRTEPTGHEIDTGSAARFFYCAKASGSDRSSDGQAVNIHTTVKPTDLMQYLCRLVTPPGGTILDPFLGSGSTMKAALIERFNCVGIELDSEYAEIARARLNELQVKLF